MTGMDDIRASKLLSLVLRHDPGKVGLRLDPQGWVAVPDLLAALRKAGRVIDREQLLRVVRESDKQRFAVDPAADRIRANQGHSVAVDLDLPVAVPPAELFHGTPVRNVASIEGAGLRRGARHAVHLSADRATAAKVGARRGEFVIFVVDAARMSADGAVFTVSANGVWLADEVPARYLRLDRP
jgi:putative RNA 2'-phosphotransferase